MTYPSPLLRLVVSGPLYTSESWSFGLNMRPDFNNPPYNEPTEVSEAVVDAVKDFLYLAGVSAPAALGSIKLNLIGEDGRYVNEDTVEWAPPTPTTDQRPAQLIAPQIALAVTLRTDAARGLAHSGRFYLPVPSQGLTGDGRIQESAALTVANAAATFINDLNAALPGFRVCVASSVGAGRTRVVTRVEVGRVLDTIRSRRTSLPEEHVPAVTEITA